MVFEMAGFKIRKTIKGPGGGNVTQLAKSRPKPLTNRIVERVVVEVSGSPAFGWRSILEREKKKVRDILSERGYDVSQLY